MSKCHSELTQKEQEMLKIRRDSDTKAAELVKMERMLQQTKNLLDKKTESGSKSLGYQENMGECYKQGFLTSYFHLQTFSLLIAVSDIVLCCLPQWRTWRKRCAPADDTGETPSITRRCWRARWKLWKVSWWAPWTTFRSWGMSYGVHSRRQKNARPQWRSWLQGSGEEPWPQ